MPRRLNSEPPRCAWCDQRLPDQSALIAHQLEHRGSAEDLAAGLEAAATDGLRAQAGVPRRAGSDA